MEWTGARYVDAPTVEASTWINGTAEQVWQVVSDVELMPTLSGELQSATWCDGCTGPGVGHKFVGHNKHDAMGEWSTTSYIVECEPPRVFAWAVQDSANPTSSWRFTLEPAAGGTTLRQWMQMGPAPSGLSIAIERMPELEQKIVFVRLRELESSITNTLAAIKQRIESCAPRPQ
ncbi:MAG TPA: SRPBCC family protein [Pseudonocardiaceae bacterium]|nr:SRPBCC family protein [Pseudonocardiaceae bacterium]